MLTSNSQCFAEALYYTWPIGKALMSTSSGKWRSRRSQSRRARKSRAKRKGRRSLSAQIRSLEVSVEGARAGWGGGCRGGGEEPNSQEKKGQEVQKEEQKAKALEVQVQAKTKGQQQPQHFRRYCCAASGWFDEEG